MVGQQPIHVRCDLVFGFEGEPAVPERALFVERHAVDQSRHVGELGADGLVQLLGGLLGVLRADAAVDEEHTIHDGDRVALAEPAAVLPVAAEREPVFHPAEWAFSLPRVAVRAFVSAGRIGQPLVRRIAQVSGVGRTEGGELSGRDVAKVACDVHGFVVADQHVYPSAGPGGLSFQVDEQVHDLARVRAAVEEVARLHELRAAAGPLATAVDDTGVLQHVDELVEAAVHVADGHDPRRRGGGGGGRYLEGRPGEQCGRYRQRVGRHVEIIAREGAPDHQHPRHGPATALEHRAARTARLWARGLWPYRPLSMRRVDDVSGADGRRAAVGLRGHPERRRPRSSTTSGRPRQTLRSGSRDTSAPAQSSG